MTQKHLTSLGKKIDEIEKHVRQVQDRLDASHMASLEREAILEAERNYLELSLKGTEKVEGWALTRSAHHAKDWMAQAAFPVTQFKHRARSLLSNLGLAPEAAFERLVFNLDCYLVQAQDAPKDHDRALAHYLSQGEAKGLWPTTIFQPDFYAQHIPGLVIGQGRAILHFLEHGLLLGWSPCPEIDRIALRAKLENQSIPDWLFNLSASI